MSSMRPSAAMRFRASTPADLRVVSSWVRTQRECDLWAGPGLDFPLDTNALPQLLGLGRTESVSLLDGHGLVAFGQLIAKSSERAHVARVIVRPDSRGRGMGRALLDELVHRAALQRVARVSLYVNRTNDAAIGLYQSLGFRLAERPADDPPSRTSWYMEREAAP